MSLASFPDEADARSVSAAVESDDRAVVSDAEAVDLGTDLGEALVVVVGREELDFVGLQVVACCAFEGSGVAEVFLVVDDEPLAVGGHRCLVAAEHGVGLCGLGCGGEVGT